MATPTAGNIPSAIAPNTTSQAVLISTLLTSMFQNVTFEDNCSFHKEHYFQVIATRIGEYASPFTFAIGLPANLLSFLVWIQPSMVHSSGVYLAALAVDDFIVLTLQLVTDHFDWMTPGVCELILVLLLASQYLDPLLVLGFTVERYISICFPFKRKEYCTVRRAKLVTCFLSLFALALCGIQAILYSAEGLNYCDPEEEDVSGLMSVWSWTTEMLMFVIVPVLVLTFNICVIWAVMRPTNALQEVNDPRSKKSPATTRMLLGASFYLIGQSLLSTLSFMFLESEDFCTFDESDSVLAQAAIKRLMRVLTEEITMFYYASNFFIYLITGRMFKNELKKLLGRMLFCRCTASRG